MNTAVKLALAAFMVWVSYHDIKCRKIENFAHLVIILFSVFANNVPVAERFAGGLTMFGLMLFMNIVTKNGIGMGDVKLCGAFGIGAGTAVFAAVLTGMSAFVLFAGGRVIVKKSAMREALPLAPFLCAGYAVTIFLC